MPWFNKFFWLVLVFLPVPAMAQSVQQEGGCLIAHLRDTAKPVSPNIDRVCTSIPNATMPGGKAFQEYYSWVMPFLMSSFDTAERAHCGVPGCATGGAHVRLVLFYEGRVDVAVKREGAGEITIAISAGTIDFVEAVTIMMFQDMKDDPDKSATNGLRKWLEELSEQGVQACRLRTPLPKFTIDLSENFALIRTAAAAVYSFIFAHELSHVRAGSTCGVDQTKGPLAIETACDMIAFSKLSEYGAALPSQIIAWFVSVHRYERLAGPMLAPPGMNLETAAPARDWTERARSISSQWSQVCRGSTKLPTCAPAWRNLHEYGDELIDIDLPEPCLK